MGTEDRRPGQYITDYRVPAGQSGGLKLLRNGAAADRNDAIEISPGRQRGEGT